MKMHVQGTVTPYMSIFKRALQWTLDTANMVLNKFLVISNHFHNHDDFDHDVPRKLQRCIENPVKHLRLSVLEK